MTSMRKNDTDLQRALDALRRVDACTETPARVAATVMAAWDAAYRSPATTSTKRAWHSAGALAAAAMMVVALGALARQLRQTTQQSADGGTRRTVVLVGEPILAGEPVRLVRMRLPASTLAALGIHSPSDGDHLDVDVIVGEDGIARAIQVGM